MGKNRQKYCCARPSQDELLKWEDELQGCAGCQTPESDALNFVDIVSGVNVSPTEYYKMFQVYTINQQKKLQKILPAGTSRELRITLIEFYLCEEVPQGIRIM